MFRRLATKEGDAAEQETVSRTLGIPNSQSLGKIKPPDHLSRFSVRSNSFRIRVYSSVQLQGSRKACDSAG